VKTLVTYSVRRAGKPPSVVVSKGGEKVATLSPEGKLRFALESEGDGKWMLDPRVHGEVRPFSMKVSPSEAPSDAVLTIRNGVFFHRGKAYAIAGIPEDVHPADHLLGKRYVSRLDTFPFSKLEEVDLETWGRLRRHRGVPVGTVEEREQDEFQVDVSGELEDIGLELSAAAYLLYSKG
jgi:hypothetical protein